MECLAAGGVWGWGGGASLKEVPQNVLTYILSFLKCTGKVSRSALWRRRD